jgi:selT/selW/selH-like putative selenoprotein
VSKQIKKIMPSAQVEGNAKPPRSGAFEITLNDKLVYSKIQTGNFPNTGDIKSWF